MTRGTLESIRSLYFRTTETTVERDLAQAIELFKALPDERSRQQAAVYMDGLSQMRSEWRLARRRRRAAGAGKKR